MRRCPAACARRRSAPPLRRTPPPPAAARRRGAAWCTAPGSPAGCAQTALRRCGRRCGVRRVCGASKEPFGPTPPQGPWAHPRVGRRESDYPPTKKRRKRGWRTRLIGTSVVHVQAVLAHSLYALVILFPRSHTLAGLVAPHHGQRWHRKGAGGGSAGDGGTHCAAKRIAMVRVLQLQNLQPLAQPQLLCGGGGGGGERGQGNSV